jgi:mono/diheme cytochrome c family protein
MRLILAGAVALAASLGHAASLEFVRDGTTVRRLDDAALERTCKPRTIEVEDPYYERRERYRACPLATVVEAGFGTPIDRLDAEDVVFRALDGYAKPSPPARVAEDGGWVAFGGPDGAHFAPMGRRALDPGPFYVVWTGAEQRDTHRYPWPYQLAAIELTSLARKFPHTVPDGLGTGDLGWRGFAIFRSDCIACHSMNGEGGKVGPDLNVPRSIIEYWPADQVKAYVRNPASFRYGNMPSHEHLTDADLDALVAYFRAMQARKHDPGARP